MSSELIISVKVSNWNGNIGTARRYRNQLNLTKEVVELLDIRDPETEFVYGTLRDSVLTLKRSEHGKKVSGIGERKLAHVCLNLGLTENTDFEFIESCFDGNYDIHEFKLIDEKI
ncbi:MAG: hypothetical protein HEP71_34280 [Roseivirga sp.]|nr:hypothetical protein [Roseivirga sp.]